MPLNNILKVKLFDLREIDFIGQFSPHILKSIYSYCSLQCLQMD